MTSNWTYRAKLAITGLLALLIVAILTSCEAEGGASYGRIRVI
jgi:hypothetical protein